MTLIKELVVNECMFASLAIIKEIETGFIRNLYNGGGLCINQL